MSFDVLLHRLDPRFQWSELQRRRAKYWRMLRRVDRRLVTLAPASRPRGSVLFSYVIDPFLLRPGKPMPHGHTHFWESWAMAQAFVELGYEVDAVHWTNQRFVPRKPYAVAIDVRRNLARWAEHLPGETVKVMHAETAHPSFHNPAQRARLEALAERRGTSLKPRKTIRDHGAYQAADLATILGNEFTQETYLAVAKKPLHRIPISAPLTYDWPATKDFDAVRRRFVWFGSGGLVHKGLDLVLEAFAAMPEYHLTVCGPIRQEADFERLYFRELYRTPNIETAGWVDVAGERFRRLAAGSLGLIYPSCSEGGGGSVLTCMHASLIPIVNREVSVDVDRTNGVPLADCSIATIQETVRQLAARPAGELEGLARSAWRFAREHHTRDRFQAAYRRFAARLVGGS